MPSSKLQFPTMCNTFCAGARAQLSTIDSTLKLNQMLPPPDLN